MTRSEAARKFCERLARDVEQIAPAGLGGWDHAWEIVAAADVDFVLALTRWEATGTTEHRELVRPAYNRVLDAWRRASTLYEQRTSESTP